MSKNSKKSSQRVAALAASKLSDSNSSSISRRLAGSVLSQSRSNKETGSEMESVAASVLNSTKYSSDTKTLAASVLSQSNKQR